MSKRKGLSVEEKRSRMMKFFFEKKDFFLLKELEKQCQKEKGITSMSVKDILMSLVDDAMVDTDKIGTSVYFWSFPSKVSQNMKRKIEDLEQKLKQSEAKKVATEEAIKKARVGKEESEERNNLLVELGTQQKKMEVLNAELDKYKECDPEVLDAMRKDAATAKDAANRWTDNVFSTKSWIKKKFAFDGSTLDKQFGIPADFDYVE